jgi:DNA repair exonuclease SbcCD nuclease subunit
MIKLLHIADVHLDTTFLCRSEEVRRQLREAIRTAFRNAVNCAIEEDVDAFLIAGDLFDGRRLSFSTERFLIQELERLDRAGIECFYAAGNHDPGGSHSRINKMDLPASFHYFDSAVPQSVILRSNDEEIATIVGAGHESEREERNLTDRFPDAHMSLPTIGLLHALVTSASGVEAHDRYAACAVADLKNKGYAYWALGHVHERQRVDDDRTLQYSGNIQGRTPRETGPRGGYLVVIDGSEVHATFRPFHQVEWLDLVIDDLETVGDAAGLERHIVEAYREAVGGPGGTEGYMVRIILSGATPLAADLVREDYVSDLAGELAIRLGLLDVSVVCRNVMPPVDLTQYRSQQHVLGEVLELIDELAEKDELLTELAPVPLAAAGVTELDVVPYLRQLLEHLAPEAAARLLTEEH